MKKFRTLVEQKLYENDLTQRKLLELLKNEGFKVDAAELSKAVTGERKTPKAERILDASLDIINEYEKKMLERLLKLQEK